MNEDFETLPVDELSNLLRQFYGEARKKDGQSYSRNGIAGLRSAIHRHITSAPFHRKINIMHDAEFKAANNVLLGTLKVNKRAGKDVTKSFTPINAEDMRRLMSSGVFGVETPKKLQDLVWFSIQFFFCRRGCEGVRELKKDSFIFLVDAEGREYVRLAYHESSKNHPGGFKNTNDPVKKMYATGGPNCPVNALKVYLNKLNPESDALYQRPVSAVCVTKPDDIWYAPIPLGIKRLQGMMARISTEAGLSMRYTNHCLRATCITTLMRHGYHPITVTRLSGHRNVASVMSYCKDTTDEMKRHMSGTLASSLDGSRRGLQIPSTASALPSAMGAPPVTSISTPPAMNAVSAPPATISAPPAISAISAPPAPGYSLQETPQQNMLVQSNTMNRNNALSAIFANCTVTIGSLSVGYEGQK